MSQFIKCEICGKDYYKESFTGRNVHPKCEEYRNKIHTYCKEKYGIYYNSFNIDRYIKSLDLEIDLLYDVIVWCFENENIEVEKTNGGLAFIKWELPKYYINQKKNKENQKLSSINFKDYLPKEKEVIVLRKKEKKLPRGVKLRELD